MFVLVEAFDADDLERARRLFGPDHAAAPATLVGLNTRNLATLEVDPGRLETLAGEFPPGLPAVAESGLATAADCTAAANNGYSLGLVGTK